jgi:phosphatidylglycerol:prolipoprotein diacylglycerol transferase
LGVLLYSALYKIPTLKLLDFAAPGMALGHAIGRWGNFINRELYGPPTTLPWGLDIPPAYRIPPYNDLQQYPVSTRFHPAFLYESLVNLALCLSLMWLAKHHYERLKDGTIMVLYLMGYSIIRFFMDYLRTDGTTAQPLALAFVALGALFLVIQYQPWKKVGLAG